MYPIECNYLCYTLGLIGEFHEFKEAIEDYTYNFLEFGKPPPVFNIKKEGGDVMWYAEAILQLYGMTLKDLDPTKKFKPAFNPYEITNLKKVPRDRVTINKYKDIVIECVNWFVNETVQLANEYHVSFDEMLLENYTKLISRAERGVISGDGDNR